MEKKYTGSCYIGVVGGETEVGECRDSIEMIKRRSGDTRPIPIRGTKGYEVRSLHIERWRASDHPFCLLLDHDMVFEPDTLERLRSHQLPFVSGFYLRRRWAPLAPVWFEPYSGSFPLKPFTVDPVRGQLHELGASGWGCILLHRDVIDAVEPILKGEHFVIEDDMDIYPYDLQAVIDAIRSMRSLMASDITTDTMTAINKNVTVLENEIRVLRGTKDPVGSDLRFPFFAKLAGFALYGDPDVRCRHMLNYPLSPDDYCGQDAEWMKDTQRDILKGFWMERRKMYESQRLISGEGWRCKNCKWFNVSDSISCQACGGKSGGEP